MNENLIEMKSYLERQKRRTSKSFDTQQGISQFTKKDSELCNYFSQDILTLLQRYSDDLDLPKLAGILSLYARDLCELEFRGEAQSIDREKHEKFLKRFMCDLILSKSPIIKSLGELNHPIIHHHNKTE